ncbi:N-acetylmuramoyl-L-alanine amidase [Streptomyces flaveolus]|uniref:N-acetylmuramoyl-L-alanine amidase n=1 Tax=Streptomyces flaveolus TaxID=67297 RepID=A0ABV1VTE6_9ACTN
MAVPLSANAFVKALKAEGLTVVEVGDWRTHNRNSRGPWGPVHGVMIHHTVTKGSARTVDICRKGYSGLPGPLCHGVITKDGTVHLVGYGRANHAGSGDDDVLRAVIGEQALPVDNEANTDGNRCFYGFECENLGDGKDPWPAAQLLAIEKVAAAICREHGWSERSTIGHLEWQPGKVDPRGFTMASMRARIAERLGAGSSSGTGSPDGTTYTVKQGDTLWSIAAGRLGDGNRWREIAALNKLADADEIAPGQKLKLPEK